MESQEEKGIKTLETPEAVARYDRLKGLGRELLAETAVVKEGKVSEQDVKVARKFLAKAAQEANPPVWSSYWDYVLIAPELGRRLAKAVKDKGLEVDPQEIEFLLWLHDIGRFVTPGAYLRNDLIGDRLLRECGIPWKVFDNLPSIVDLSSAAEKMELKDKQVRFQEPLTHEQEELAKEYFNSQSPTQRIINLADNLGKRGPDGLFDIQRFVVYLKTQEGRYDQTSPWSSVGWAIPRRQAGALLQSVAVEETAQWLKEIEVDFGKIREGLRDYGPKFVVVARHGELNNPKGIVYNRDSVMNPDEIIHLSDEGRKQTENLARVMNERRFQCTRINSSPEVRAQESAQILNQKLNPKNLETVEELDDSYSPGPYREGMTLDQLAEIGGNVYEESRWGKYGHERPKQIIERMERAFWTMAQSLKVGETGIIVSHGDPIAWLANHLVSDRIPDPKDLRKLIYPVKGQAVVAVIDSSDHFFTAYLLNEVSPRGIY